MDILLRVIGQEIRLAKENFVVGDSQNFLHCKFTFSDEWNEINKTAVFQRGEAVFNVLLDTDGRCLVPYEVIKYPSFSVSVFGGDLLTANKADITVFESGMVEGEAPPVPTPLIYDQLLNSVAEQKALAQESAVAAAENAARTAADKVDVENAVNQVEENAAAVSADKLYVISQRQLTEIYKNAAETARNEAQQALTDFLAMLGSDIATLTGGKLTPAQIPALSINDVFEIADPDDMLALDAQRGDVALIVSEDVVTDSYLLAADNPTDPANWKKLGVSYVANAGHAVTTDNAANADMVNGHRIVRFSSIAELEAAVKVPGTLYYAPYDEE